MFGGKVEPYESILIFDAKDIAEQLTLIEFEIYRRIQPRYRLYCYRHLMLFSELLTQTWNNPKKNCLGLNVVDLIQRANLVSFWVATCILLQPVRIIHVVHIYDD